MIWSNVIIICFAIFSASLMAALAEMTHADFDQGKTQSHRIDHQDAHLNSHQPTQWLVKKGEVLWCIANTIYGDPRHFTAIAAVNPFIQDPDLIFPDQTLDLPDSLDVFDTTLSENATRCCNGSFKSHNPQCLHASNTNQRAKAFTLTVGHDGGLYASQSLLEIPVHTSQHTEHKPAIEHINPVLNAPDVIDQAQLSGDPFFIVDTDSGIATIRQGEVLR